MFTLLPFALLGAIFAVALHLKRTGGDPERRSDAPDAAPPASAPSPAHR